jgi:putative DNA primase/helicase
MLGLRSDLRSRLTVNSCEFDADPFFISFKNGLCMDLKSGADRKIRPDDLTRMYTGVPFLGFKAPREVFLATLLECFGGDSALVLFFQVLCGLALIGKVIEHIIVILTGIGRNGKGVITKSLSFVVGDYSCVVPSSMLMVSRAPQNPNAPTACDMMLRKVRLAFASETGDGARFDSARAKFLSGGDGISGRNPHDRYMQNFEPSHTIFLQTNFLPHVSAQDFAFWERVINIHLPISFVRREPTSPNERKAKDGLEEALLREGPGILAWMIEGCFLYQKNGLIKPESVLRATNDYRRGEDFLADFLESECVVSEHAMSQAADLYDRFEAWYARNISKKNPISQKRFSQMLAQKFSKEPKGGRIFYLGVGLR